METDAGAFIWTYAVIMRKHTGATVAPVCFSRNVITVVTSSFVFSPTVHEVRLQQLCYMATGIKLLLIEWLVLVSRPAFTHMFLTIPHKLFFPIGRLTQKQPDVPEAILTEEAAF